MNIYLITDEISAFISEPLIAYLQPIMSDRVAFHTRQYSGIVKSFWEWEDLFAVGHQEKAKSLLPPGEHYFIFLYYGANEHNWFGSLNQDEPNVGFLQSFGWEKFDFNDPIYPIAYHLMTLVTAMKFFGQEPNIDFYHGVSKGCMFDFAGIREEVRYKLQSGQICPECLGKIAQRANDRAEAMDYVHRLLSLFKSVKENMFSIELEQYFGELDYRLLIEPDTSLVLEVDNRRIPLQISSGKEKAIFMTILKYQSGLTYKDFEREEILKEYLWLYYRYFINQGSYESLYRQAKQLIADRTFKKQLEPLICRIRKKLQAALSAYPQIFEAVTIKSSQGSLLVPIQRRRLQNNLSNYKLDVG
jgi:hypothetical protein